MAGPTTAEEIGGQREESWRRLDPARERARSGRRASGRLGTSTSTAEGPGPSGLALVSPDAVIRLQRLAGNAAVTRLVGAQRLAPSGEGALQQGQPVREGREGREVPAPSVQRLTGEQQTAIFSRAAGFDYELLSDVAAKAPLVQEINHWSLGREEAETLKQLMLTTSISAESLAKTVSKAASSGNLRSLIPTLASRAQRSSSTIYSLVTECRSLLGEFFRYNQNKSETALDSLDSEAQGYDRAGPGAHDAKLTHKETRGFLFFKKKQTVRHTMKDVVTKVRTVGTLDLRTMTSPTAVKVSVSTDGKHVARDPHVGVVGGGPIGLMAAIEARLKGARVTLFEARSEQYSRRQVLVLDASTRQKFASLGIDTELFEGGANKGAKGSGGRVAVKYIEKALIARARELGISIISGFHLVGAKKDDKNGQTELELVKVDKNLKDDKDQKKKKVVETKHEFVDLLVVASGAGIARPNPHTNVVLAKELGIEYSFEETKDYAAVGLFEANESGGMYRAQGLDGKEHTPFGGLQGGRWKYRFNTPKVTYILHQITPELMEKFKGEGGTKLLQEEMLRIAGQQYEMVDPKLAPMQNKRGESTPNVGFFPIEIQRAKKFVNDQLNALVIGDSAGTPHPHTGSGLNTGVRELDALGDVVTALRERIAQRHNLKQKGIKEGGSEGEGELVEGEESDNEINDALAKYNEELRSLTGVMNAKALNTLRQEQGKFLYERIHGLSQLDRNLLDSDFASGGTEKLDKIKEKAAAWRVAKSTDGDIEHDLELLRMYRGEVDRILSNLAKLKPEPKSESKPESGSGGEKGEKVESGSGGGGKQKD